MRKNIKTLLNNKIPKIAVIVYGDKDIESAKISQKLKVDFLEIRFDLYKDVTSDEAVKIIKKIRNVCSLPLIGTLRLKTEGGKYLPSSKRSDFLKTIIPHLDIIDIEINSKESQLIQFAHQNKKLAIASYHNFKNMPKDLELENLLLKSKRLNADITKIAVTPKNEKEIISLFQFTYKHKDKNLITIALGKFSPIFRVTSFLFGSLLTYTYIDTPVVDGQINLSTLIEYLRFFYPDYNKKFDKE